MVVATKIVPVGVEPVIGITERCSKRETIVKPVNIGTRYAILVLWNGKVSKGVSVVAKLCLEWPGVGSRCGTEAIVTESGTKTS